MSYVDRDVSGNITGLYSNPQHDGQEFVANAQIYSDPALEKAQALTEARALRERILARLNGLHIDAIYNGDIPPVIAAIMVSKQSLKDITVHPTVIAAVGGAATRAAVLSQYYAIAAALGANAPTAVSAFVVLDQ